MARWTASAKWAAGPALDGQCATLLGLALSEGLGTRGRQVVGDIALIHDDVASGDEVGEQRRQLIFG